MKKLCRAYGMLCATRKKWPPCWALARASCTRRGKRIKADRTVAFSCRLPAKTRRSGHDAAWHDWTGQDGRQHGAAVAKKRAQVRRVRPQRGFREAIGG